MPAKVLRSLSIQLAAVAVVTIGALSLVSTSSQAQETLRLHMFSPFSGPLAFYGPAIRQGFDLALEDSSAALAGRKVEVVNVDDECKPEKAVSSLNKILDEALLLLGPVCTGNLLATQRTLIEEKIPHIFMGYGAIVTQKNDPFVVAASVSDKAMSEAIIKWGLDTKKFKKWAIIHDTTGYGAAGAQTFAAAVAGIAGTQLVKAVNFKPGEREFTGLLKSLENEKADAIFLIGYEVDLGILVKQAGQAGIKTPLIGSAAFVNPELSKAAAPHAEGIPFVTMMVPSDPNPAVQAFVKKFQAKHGVTPKDTATLGYVTGLVFADAVKRIKGKVTRENLTQAIKSTKIADSPVGAIEYDASGARKGDKLSVIGVIKDGAPSFLTRN